MYDFQFWYFIANRMLSGIVNGLFYAGSAWAFPVGFIFIAFTFWHLSKSQKSKWKEMKKWKRFFSIIGIFSSVISGGFILRSFARPGRILSDIHLWTFLNQTAISSTLFLHSKKFWSCFKPLLLAVSPSAFFQKVMINVIPGNRWDYHGTDDPTGRTWGFKLLKIKIPRLGNMYIKLTISAICIVLFLLMDRREKRKQQKLDSIQSIEIIKGA